MGKASFEDLCDTWYKLREALQIVDDSPEHLHSWHRYIFEKTLTACGWEVTQWNSEVERSKQTNE